jgi:hypothetical protein
MNKISSQNRSSLIKLAASLPASSKERRDVLSVLKVVVAAPDYLPKSGLVPFTKIMELVEETPEGNLKQRCKGLADGMFYAAKQFFGRGERFKPQSENVLQDARSLLSLISHLNHPKEGELKKLVSQILKDFTPIVDSMKN